MSASLASKIESMIAPLIEELGLEIYDVEIGNGRKGGMLRVVLKKPGAFDDQEGVTLDQLVEANREISALLDVEDPIRGRYQLDVESPGVERRLRTLSHFEGAVGAQAHVVLTELVEGSTVYDGQIHEVLVEDEEIILQVKEREVAVPHSLIKNARLIYDWQKGGRKRR